MAKITFKGIKFELEGVKDFNKTELKDSGFELGRVNFGIEEYSVEGNLEEVTKMMYEFGRHVIDRVPFEDIAKSKAESNKIRMFEAETRREEAKNVSKELELRERNMSK